MHNYDNLNRQTDFYVYGTGASTPDIIAGVKLNGSQLLTYGYDYLNRLSTRTLNTATPYVTEYTYLPGGKSTHTTTLVQSVKNGNDILIKRKPQVWRISNVRFAFIFI